MLSAPSMALSEVKLSRVLEALTISLVRSNATGELRYLRNVPRARYVRRRYHVFIKQQCRIVDRYDKVRTYVYTQQEECNTQLRASSAC